MRIIFVLLATVWVAGIFGWSYLHDPASLVQRSPLAIGIDIAQLLSPLALLGVVYSFDQQRQQLKTQREAFDRQMEAMNSQAEALRDQAVALVASVDAQRQQADYLGASAKAQRDHTQAMMETLKVQTAHTDIAQTAQQITLIDRRIAGFLNYAIQSTERAQLSANGTVIPLLGSMASLTEAKEKGPIFCALTIIEAIKAANRELDGADFSGTKVSDAQRASSLMGNLSTMAESVQSFIESCSEEARLAVKFEIDYLRLSKLVLDFNTMKQRMDTLHTDIVARAKQSAQRSG